MQHFKSSNQAQDFLSAHSFIYGPFHPRRHRLAAHAFRTVRSEAFLTWQQDGEWHYLGDDGYANRLKLM